MKFEPFNVAGHTVTLESIDRKGMMTMKLRRRWWAPLWLAFVAASLAKRRWAPFVFAYALIYFAALAPHEETPS